MNIRNFLMLLICGFPLITACAIIDPDRDTLTVEQVVKRTDSARMMKERKVESDDGDYVVTGEIENEPPAIGEEADEEQEKAEE